MKKILFLTLLSCWPMLNSSAQRKLNPQGQLIVEQWEMERAGKLHAPDQNGLASPLEHAIISLNPGYTAQNIIDLGFGVITNLGEILTIEVPVERICELEDCPAVKSISIGGYESVNMNFARQSGIVDQVQDGFDNNGVQYSFDGEGVIAGFMDIGFEANHVNFINSDGDSRIGALWNFTGSNGNGSVRQYNSSNINRFTCDTDNESHATHVAGIMAGSYNGASKYANMTSATAGGRVTSGKNPFYGVATGAEIAGSVGSLTHANIIDGVANIVNYAEEQNKPCVVNLSLGSTYGPHDGTDDYTRALSLLGKRAVIVMAAGNDGDVNLSITKNFTASDTQLKTLISDNKANGIVDVWNSDNTALKVSWCIYDKDKQQLIVLASSTDGKTVRVNSQNSTFAASFSGSIEMVSGIDPNNNRYNSFCNCSVSPKSGNETKLLALMVEGNANTKVDIFGYQIAFENPYWVGWMGGSNANTINNACCGSNILSVGAYTTRTHWSTLNSSSAFYYPGSVLNDICAFSSYGTTFAGKELPMVAAPGSAIISSYNYYYLQKNSETNDMSASAEGVANTDYWGQMQGTSMACPFVSGTIALWLQANPYLQFADVLDVINATSVTDRYTRKAPERFGAGKIDALAGIKKVLDEKAGVGTVWADDESNLIVTPVDGGYNVYVAGEANLVVTVYDTAGSAVVMASTDGNTVDVDTSSLMPGVYIIAAQGHSQCHVAKVAVK